MINSMGGGILKLERPICKICKCTTCSTVDCDGTFCFDCTSIINECVNYIPKNADKVLIVLERRF